MNEIGQIVVKRDCGSSSFNDVNAVDALGTLAGVCAMID